MYNYVAGLGTLGCFASCPYRGPLTADKREIKDFPKFAYLRTSFIRQPLSEIARQPEKIYKYKEI